MHHEVGLVEHRRHYLVSGERAEAESDVQVDDYVRRGEDASEEVEGLAVFRELRHVARSVAACDVVGGDAAGEVPEGYRAASAAY